MPAGRLCTSLCTPLTVVWSLKYNSNSGVKVHHLQVHRTKEIWIVCQELECLGEEAFLLHSLALMFAKLSVIRIFTVNITRI